MSEGSELSGTLGARQWHKRKSPKDLAIGQKQNSAEASGKLQGFALVMRALQSYTPTYVPYWWLNPEPIGLATRAFKGAWTVVSEVSQGGPLASWTHRQCFLAQAQPVPSREAPSDGLDPESIHSIKSRQSRACSKRCVASATSFTSSFAGPPGLSWLQRPRCLQTSQCHGQQWSTHRCRQPLARRWLLPRRFAGYAGAMCQRHSALFGTWVQHCPLIHSLL